MIHLEGTEEPKAVGLMGQPDARTGPLGLLPTLSRRAIRLRERIGSQGPKMGPISWLAEVSPLLAKEAVADRFEVLWRASGLRRPGAIAQLNWPRLATRVGLGIEPALAHAIVDRLLGFDRLPAEGRFQVTPVEWGILSFAIARALGRIDRQAGPLGPWDLLIDRVGPDPFDPEGLGPIVTWKWRVQIGETSGTARLWIPESLLAQFLQEEPRPGDRPPLAPGRFRELTGIWRAEGGRVEMPRGLGRLRAGSVLPIEGSPLKGAPQSPQGTIELTLSDRTSRSSFLAQAVPDSAGAQLILQSNLRREPRPRETYAMPIPAEPTPGPSTGPEALGPAEVPVTLTVELGRISLSLGQVADLKPGDVLELGRHSREPVELTSGGKMIARGELVQIDNELGVRVIHVFL